MRVTTTYIISDDNNVKIGEEHSIPEIMHDFGSLKWDENKMTIYSFVKDKTHEGIKLKKN